MEKLTINLFEESKESRILKGVVSEMIDSMIKSRNMLFLTEWEANHSISRNEVDNEISRLKEVKNKLRNLVNSDEKGKLVIDIKVIK